MTSITTRNNDEDDYNEDNEDDNVDYDDNSDSDEGEGGSLHRGTSRLLWTAVSMKLTIAATGCAGS
jgi:hypothetical protein